MSFSWRLFQHLAALPKRQASPSLKMLHRSPGLLLHIWRSLEIDM